MTMGKSDYGESEENIIGDALSHCLSAQNSPPVFSLGMTGLGLRKSFLLCQMAPCYTLPVGKSRMKQQSWKRKKGLAPSSLFPVSINITLVMFLHPGSSSFP